MRKWCALQTETLTIRINSAPRLLGRVCLLAACVAAPTLGFTQGKPYYLASATPNHVEFWKINPEHHAYKLVAKWEVPQELTIETIHSYPKSRKLLIRASYSFNRKLFTISLSESGKISTVSHGWIGYGYPAISPSERTVAVLGLGGCYGYVNLVGTRSAGKLNDWNIDGETYLIGKSRSRGDICVGTWQRIRFHAQPLDVIKYVWKGERVVEDLQVEVPFREEPPIGVLMDPAGSLLQIEQSGTQRFTGRNGKIRKQALPKFAFKVFSHLDPGDHSGLSLFLNSAGSPVVLSTWGESALLSNPKQVRASLQDRIRKAINTSGNGDVALATKTGIRIGRWVGPHFQQSMILPGKDFKFWDIEYLGLAPK